MRPQELEPEVEEFFARLLPDLDQELRGATQDEVDRIERIAGCILPRFYRWFLLRMGEGMGPLAYPTLDFRASTVLSCYAERLFMPHPRFLMIGHETNEMMPLHALYDFEHPARYDARVVKRSPMGGAIYNRFETFREMIVWGVFRSEYVGNLKQRCRGSLTDGGGDVLSHLDPVMKSMGFVSPIPTGPCCGVYQGAGLGLATSATPGQPPRNHFFYLGGPNAGRLRRILGEIATETSLELSVDEWWPPTS
jgi:hypothetical protein